MCEKHPNNLVVFEDDQGEGVKYCEKCYSEVESKLKSKQESAAAAEEESKDITSQESQIQNQDLPEAQRLTST